MKREKISMKSTKKTISFLLAMILVLAGLSGCAQKTETEKAPAGAPADQAATSPAPEKTEPANRLEKIIANGKLQVVMEPYFAPYEFIDVNEKGQDQYKGADVELAKFIADSIGVELEIVPLEWSAVLTGISTGKYDMAISGMGYTAERAEAMELSDSYNDTDSIHGFVLKAGTEGDYVDLDSFTGKKIAYQKGTLQEMYASAQVKDLQGQPFDSVQNAILALQSGKVDAVAVSYDNGALFTEANPDLIMSTVLFEDTKDFTVVACPKGETELIGAVNAAIKEVRTGTGEDLYLKWWDEATAQAQKLGE